jgi:hypothetical protein
MKPGNWSILVVSNDADNNEIAFQRDFFVTTGIQSTVYYTPVVTANITMTPIVRTAPYSMNHANEARST